MTASLWLVNEVIIPDFWILGLSNLSSLHQRISVQEKKITRISVLGVAFSALLFLLLGNLSKDYLEDWEKVSWKVKSVTSRFYNHFIIIPSLLACSFPGILLMGRTNQQFVASAHIIHKTANRLFHVHKEFYKLRRLLQRKRNSKTELNDYFMLVTL